MSGRDPHRDMGWAQGAAGHLPSGLLGRLLAQFSRPIGPLGYVAGRLMALGKADDQWVLGLLDVQPDDRVLDVGFGPGVTVALIAERATRGLVAGVDPSEVMLYQATRRNQVAARHGRVDLRLGTVSDLPYPDEHFTKACAVHSVYFWPSLEGGLRELHRVLAPQGRLVLAVRMQRAGASRFSPSRYGLTDEQVAEIVAGLASAGFGDVTTEQRDLGRETVAAILGHQC